jgi:hypothetical protein
VSQKFISSIYVDTSLKPVLVVRFLIFFSIVGSGKWFEMQDLHIVKILPETLPLSEAYIQIFERRKQE